VEKSFGKEEPMGITLIVECNRCGRLLMAGENQKTRTCPYCGSRIDLRKAKKVASATNAFEASEILRDLKSNKGFTR
jgi:DNA-directed RNA polymerase subunit RPC12/RpoP